MKSKSMEPSAQERERMKRYSEYFFLPKCNMRGNIRAHKKKQKKKRKKQRENKNALSHARRLVVRRRDLVGVVRHLVYFLRERERER